MIVRSETPTDYEEIRALVTVTMRPTDAELVDLIRGSENYIPDLALVAEHAERVVGYALLSYVTLKGLGQRSVLALAPLCVRPERQRQGVGAALLCTGLDRADAHGAPLVTVLGHPEYYRRFGFEPARHYDIEPPSRDIPEGVFMVKPLSGYGHRFKGRIVYPPASTSHSSSVTSSRQAERRRPIAAPRQDIHRLLSIARR
ncbi:N-acetyltransferase [Candidatus Nephthysia bennettiae]|uniref:N-acetyltransferase n=1 Tax=Candidatus Nephthysia bennettiae TaxID=3127016 RepID=A0A934K4M9_9BACT|nr:N-acetyltransferase [Candidatus Dormibacteraeota bacterium]